MEKIIERTIEIFSLSAARYFLIAGVPFCLFYLLLPEKLSKFKIQQKLASRKDFIREILHSMQSTFVFTCIAMVLLLTPIRQYTMVYSHINDYPVWYIPVSVAISLVIHDTYFYWMHVFLHHKKVFKFAHLLHHKSTNPSPWTSYSFHLAEGIIEGLVLVVIVFTIPIHRIGIVLFTMVAFAINVYGHLGYEVAPKWFRKSWLFGLLNTSVHHNLHHTRFKGNYGLYFRIWDRVMGTEHPEYVKTYDQLQEKRFGSR
ncbi:sterol desaturase family protein [uncultured Pedobacter sp.]|uniref:sterol desaturase family protein n=1 Tax=uncultured Pedobacter sp. TaxID=246139 RepID=UPI0025E4D3C0|nr:sterol desaturase family protein [uncultured Pedobacter sp.]